MAWIESHQTLKDHPKTAAVCETLAAKRPHVVGHLHELWWWCIDYAPDGDITKYSNVQIARAAEWDGFADSFVDALVSAGFIDRTDTSTVIHDWMVFCGPLMERRLQRMAAKRPPLGAERTPTNRTNRTVPTKPVTPAAVAAPRPGFHRPTTQEVKDYGTSIGYLIDAQAFVDHYEANGWKVGHASMKDWRAAVRNWRRRHTDFTANGKGYIAVAPAPPPKPLTKKEAELPDEDRAEVINMLGSFKSTLRGKEIPR